MKQYKAFINNELIILKRTIIYLPVFFLITIGAALAPYLNQFNFSGFHFSQELATYIAYIAILFSVGMFSSVFVMTSITFEKTNGIHFFLFSFNIDKKIYLLSKITIPAALSVLGSATPLIIYYCSGFYPVVPVNIVVAIISIFCYNVIWVLDSILCAQIFKRVEDITLMAFFTMTVLIIGCTLLLPPWEHPVICCLTILGITVTLFFITYRVLENREVKIQLELMK